MAHDIVKQNQVRVDGSAFMYEFKFVIRFEERNTYVSVHKNHIIKAENNEITAHADCQTRRYDLGEIATVSDNDFVRMKELVNQNIDAKFSKKKLQFSIFMLSNKPKLDTCKYVFVFKEFATRKLEEIRKKS